MAVTVGDRNSDDEDDNGDDGSSGSTVDVEVDGCGGGEEDEEKGEAEVVVGYRKCDDDDENSCSKSICRMDVIIPMLLFLGAVGIVGVVYHVLGLLSIMCFRGGKFRASLCT